MTIGCPNGAAAHSCLELRSLHSVARGSLTSFAPSATLLLWSRESSRKPTDALCLGSGALRAIR
jgi:hypothetical protein